MAAELERTGASVAFLGIIDSTFNHNDAPLPLERLRSLYRDELSEESRLRLTHDLVKEWQQAENDLAGFGRYEQWRWLLEDWTAQQRLQLTAPPEVVTFALAAMRNARQWLREFAAPVDLSVGISGWWATATLAQDPNLLSTWTGLYGRQLSWQSVEGDHDSILREPRFHRQFATALEQAHSAAWGQP